MPFSFQVTKFAGHGGGTIFNKDICSRGKKNKQNRKRTLEKIICSFTIASANECHRIMANVRWIISLTVQCNVRHLVLSQRPSSLRPGLSGVRG